jgi:hypothetical protein
MLKWEILNEFENCLCIDVKVVSFGWQFLKRIGRLNLRITGLIGIRFCRSFLGDF